jgi:hypothetical protein
MRKGGIGDGLLAARLHSEDAQAAQMRKCRVRELIARADVQALQCCTTRLVSNKKKKEKEKKEQGKDRHMKGPWSYSFFSFTIYRSFTSHGQVLTGY